MSKRGILESIGVVGLPVAVLSLGVLSPEVLAGSANAGTLTSINIVSLPGGSTGSIGPVGGTPVAPNNDNSVAASANVVTYSIFHNSLGITDVEFGVTSSGGTTEYRFAQTLINNTGQPWIGFRHELGFGTGPAFVRSGAGAGLDFDDPDRDPVPVSNRLATLLHEADALTWSNGGVGLLNSLILSLAIDVPDGLATVNPFGQNRFTLRQVPVLAASDIPAPPTLLLLAAASGLAAIARSTR